MKDFVSKLLSDDLIGARSLLDERIRNLIDEKLSQVKVEVAEDVYGSAEAELDLSEANVQKIGRKRLIRVRVRKGKVQRRKIFSNMPGYTIRGGKLVRMSFVERRHRTMAAKRSKFKRRAKLGQTIRKRRISLKKRGSLGL